VTGQNESPTLVMIVGARGQKKRVFEITTTVQGGWRLGVAKDNRRLMYPYRRRLVVIIIIIASLLHRFADENVPFV